MSIGDKKATVEVRKVGEGAAPSRPVLILAPPTVLENWENTLFWYTFDHSVQNELTREHAADSAQGLKVWFDLSRYEWPALIAPLTPAQDLTEVAAFCVDIYVPNSLTGLGIVLLVEAKHVHETPHIPINPGWNKIRVELDDSWLPRAEWNAVKEFQWILTALAGKPAGWVVFDSFRAEKAASPSLAFRSFLPRSSGEIRPVFHH